MKRAAGDLWYRVQPYMIALATCSGAVMLANGQEFGRSQYVPESDDGLPKISSASNPRPLDWTQAADPTGQTIQARYNPFYNSAGNTPHCAHPTSIPTITTGSMITSAQTATASTWTSKS